MRRGRLACVDYLPPKPSRPGGVRFLFDGGTFSDAALNEVTLQEAEIADYVEYLERLRTEGAAGGTRPVPPEKRSAVGAGAGPHRRDNLPSPAKLPRDEPVEPK